ncbi:MAG: C40 family peptidase [Flavobacteriaceae bacterium]|nr:C40 family peptidase [Flavobacteriaceae bacterium]
MKQFIIILFAISLLVSCKSSSPIVTSKEAAQKRGSYAGVSVSKTASDKSTATSRSEKSTNSKASQRKYRSNDDSDYKIEIDNTTSYLTKQLISAALQYEGVRYKGGGTTSAGMDCSGLVCTVFKKHEISLPRTSRDMSTIGKKISKKEIQRGDLVFFKTNGRSVINHVGLVTDIKNGEVFFIHASVQRGVIISSMNEAYYQRTFAQANRVID